MDANENALTQPKFELWICGFIQSVFQGDYTTKQKFKKIVGRKINYFPREGGGYPSMENSMEIINILFEPFPVSIDASKHPEIE